MAEQVSVVERLAAIEARLEALEAIDVGADCFSCCQPLHLREQATGYCDSCRTTAAER